MKKLSSTALFLAGLSSVVVATEAQAQLVQPNLQEQTQHTSATLFQSPFDSPASTSRALKTHTLSIMSVENEETPSFTNVNDLVDYVIENLHNLNDNFRARYVGDAKSLVENKELIPLIGAARDADDYLNGIGASAGYGVSYTSTEANFNFTASYFITKEQQAFVDQEVQRIVAEIIDPSMSDLEKVLKINEYIVKNTVYSFHPSTTPHAAYALFNEGKGVCQAYAMAAYHLFLEAGLEAHYVTGWAGELHAWNLVKVDGEWFHIDPTWSDPTFQEDFAGSEHYISYQYFLLSDNVLLSERTMDMRPNLPKATSERFSAIRSIQSSPFTFNNIPYVLLPEYVNNAMYYVNYQDKSYAIDTVNLARAIPTVERFSDVRAMDILATNEALYFVNIDTNFGLSKIDLQTKAVTDLYKDGTVTSIQLNGDKVQAFNKGTLVFSETVNVPEVKPDPTPIDPVIPEYAQQLIDSIDTLNHNDMNFLANVAQLLNQWNALTKDEQVFITNKNQLFEAQTVAENYMKQIDDITEAIAQLNKATELTILVDQVSSITKALEEAHSIVQAGINNIDLLHEFATFIEEQANVEEQLTLVEQSKNIANNIVFLNKNFAQQAEQVLAMFTEVQDLLPAETVEKIAYIQTKYTQMKNLTFDHTTAWPTNKTTSNSRKPWTITLSAEVKDSPKNLENIQVVDMFGDPIHATINVQGNKIIVTPNADYADDIPYTLVIDGALENTENIKLGQGTHFTFYFKK